MNHISSVSFFCCADDDFVRRASCVHITKTNFYDDRGLPCIDGLLSPLMGPHGTTDAATLCTRCQCSRADCAGHPGHIELSHAVPHPVFPEVTITCLLVPPPALRPAAITNERKHQHAWSLLLRNVMLARSRNALETALQRYFFETNARRQGLVVGLKGKEGLMRQRLLGRRTGFCGRAVIVPCSALDLDQVGVPRQWASVLTLPETVAPYNLHVAWMPRNAQLGDIIERPLRDDDVVLINRQPTLSTDSIVALRVRLVDACTLSINPGICEPFNADFDGDEMNLYLCRSYAARAEALELMQLSCRLRFSQDAATGFEPSRGNGRFAGFDTLSDMKAEQCRRFAARDAEGLSVTLNDFLDIAQSDDHDCCSLAEATEHAYLHTAQNNSLRRMIDGGKGKKHNLFQCAKFARGLTPDAYFDGCEQVRKSLVKTYMSTPEAGYLNRKLTAMLDGLVAHYDGTLRQGTFVVSFACGFEPGQRVGARLAARLSRKVTQARLNSFHHAGHSGHEAAERITPEKLLLGQFPCPAFCAGCTPQRITPPASDGVAPAVPMSAVERTFHYLRSGKAPPKRVHRVLFTRAADTDALREAFAWVWPCASGVVVSTESRYSPRVVGVPGCPARTLSDFATKVLPCKPTTARCDNLNYICATLGVEAARAALMELGAEHLDIDASALSAYANFATQNGGLRFAKRKDIQHPHRPVASAGFETTFKCLVDAARNRVVDRLVDDGAFMIFNGTIAQPFECMPEQPHRKRRRVAVHSSPAARAPCCPSHTAGALHYKPCHSLKL